jgi:hypothetical protein
MVSPAWAVFTAVHNSLSVETLTTLPVGGGSGAQVGSAWVAGDGGADAREGDTISLGYNSVRQSRTPTHHAR